MNITRKKSLSEILREAVDKEPLELKWIKKKNGNSFLFNEVNLDRDSFNDLFGVYVIWHPNYFSKPRAVRLGQGNIRDRLKSHRENTQITSYENLKHPLLVTWAKVDGRSVSGVEAYLADELKPLVGKRFPKVTHKPVNLPELNK